ncbi:unnamed protein product [Urochloa decumbens]|uniref:Pectinesterase inhibitor domain-containing protein n=1 Tax=Urochloa decumbens TaxID=240449 RepID=A0ABC9DUN4_9POAL
MIMQERGRTTRAAMAPLCVAVVFLLATAAPPCSAAQMQMQQQQVMGIEEACRKASMAHAGVSYDHCVSSLSSDGRIRRDAGADMLSLAVAAARMAAEHASATEARMEALGEVEESPHARARLHHCLELYNAAADVLRDALDNLRARVYGKASQQLAAALGAAESCEDVWKGEERVPVATHDREYGRMAILALGLTTGAVAN